MQLINVDRFILVLQGMSTGFGTGSAAPIHGDDSIKRVNLLFNDAAADSSSAKSSQVGGKGSWWCMLLKHKLCYAKEATSS